MVRTFVTAAAGACVLALIGHHILRFQSWPPPAFPEVGSADSASGAVVADSVGQHLHLGRYGSCTYLFWWPVLGDLGNLILEARLRFETPQSAWDRWAASNQTATVGPKFKKMFNGTWARFQELWHMRPCPPGPCGPRGYPCPDKFPGFECGLHEPCCGGYCCDAAGCYQDECDNDGCYPRYLACSDSSEHYTECGGPGQCKCKSWSWLRPWKSQWLWLQ
eukprot:TRINITY_DN69917_c0_g1_i1.p1 TRINITY_DN69917_c0_g1~~TRINITY_DN69917_c0_g1_i1.p1  ORF type:complete len:240 (+),score=2.62 TRINITY_DN69917_c0_g1_i1:62-721(+)